MFFGILCQILSYFLTIHKLGEDMKRREEQFAIYIIDNNCTIRDCAKHFDISKSTVHNDLSKKLRQTNKFLYVSVYRVLNKNFLERNIRGGIATKLKYLKLKNTRLQ